MFVATSSSYVTHSSYGSLTDIGIGSPIPPLDYRTIYIHSRNIWIQLALFTTSTTGFPDLRSISATLGNLHLQVPYICDKNNHICGINGNLCLFSHLKDNVLALRFNTPYVNHGKFFVQPSNISIDTVSVTPGVSLTINPSPASTLKGSTYRHLVFPQ